MYTARMQEAAASENQPKGGLSMRDTFVRTLIALAKKIRISSL